MSPLRSISSSFEVRVSFDHSGHIRESERARGQEGESEREREREREGERERGSEGERERGREGEREREGREPSALGRTRIAVF